MLRVFNLIVIVSSLLTMQACRAQKGEKKKKPNVIFILADDMGWKDLTCYGSDFYETPNIDGIATSGMRFTDAYSASPLCSPTRASILTGQEPGRLRFTTPGGHKREVNLEPKESNRAQAFQKVAPPQSCTRLSNNYLTFAEVLKSNGYATAFMGKWHLGRPPYIPDNQGFDYVIGGREHPGPPGGFFAPWKCNTLPVRPDGAHICDAVTDEAVQYIEKNKDKPFLLCLWYYDVHAPFQAVDSLKKKYAEKLNKKHVQRSPTMAAMIETLDQNVGRVIRTVKELKLEDETIIIFTSDNGGNMYNSPDGTNPTNNYPLRGGKGINYEGGVRVPLIIKVPGITEAKSESPVVVSTVDHYISILELLDIPFPENQHTDGESYVNALKGKEYTRAPIYATFCHNVIATGNRPNLSMRHGPWRLYKFYHDEVDLGHRYELYNLEKDLSETTNLVEARPEIFKQMLAQLEAYEKDADLLVAKKNVNYRGNGAAGWIASLGDPLSVDNKELTMKVNSDSSYLQTHYTNKISDGVYYFKFEVKSNVNGKGRVGWREKKNGPFIHKEENSFDLIADSQWHTHTATFKMKRNLNSIRIKPLVESGELKFRNIKILDTGGYPMRDWPLY